MPSQSPSSNYLRSQKPWHLHLLFVLLLLTTLYSIQTQRDAAVLLRAVHGWHCHLLGTAQELQPIARPWESCMKTLLLKEPTCHFFLHFRTKDPQFFLRESDCKVHKKRECTSLVAGLYKKLLHLSSLYWDYLKYISSGVAHTVLRHLCCKSWYTVEQVL